RVNIRNKEWHLEGFSQSPDVCQLVDHLRRNYPRASFKVAYEAGFCGFHFQRKFSSMGIECMIVNPADIPSGDKEKKRKSDKLDANKLSREMAKGDLSGVYVPTEEMEHARTLVRQRTRLVWDQTRCKSRIHHMLMFSGIGLGEFDGTKYWSARFITFLQDLDCRSLHLRQSLNFALEEYVQIRKLILESTRAIRILSRQTIYADIQRVLQSIPGVGMINAMIMMTEIQDMNRFSNHIRLCSYAGIVPDKVGSGEIEKTRGITHRSNNYLRPAIIESCWTLVRLDPAMLALYNKYCQKMHENKAIIKIANIFLRRMRMLWFKKQEYVKGVLSNDMKIKSKQPR
ncbi:MAG: IS110 family transposase, partial [Chitinophagaceae bacterium]